ncbi:lycopene beta-cyclase [Novosphingobium sp. SG751A]|uniref:lycopene beta-cyclase CrtY n=1 Tax=Novosphingobium sp. SG751A TaxID=2587000 RepID=UPI0015576702|nr:lycopene beta-cyclase CrtY [Novosphingobium sp. SG751A]NOW47799.1 lycopene beta-cyclase [Novosphingobium sp. SG751A]
MAGNDTDIAILGGGLAGGLVALALAARRPDLRILLVEREEKLGGHHLWSFFLSDIPVAARWLLKPLVAGKWNSHSVRFSGNRRHLGNPYRTISSPRFDAALREALPAGSILTGATVTAFDRRGFTLADGRQFRAGAVIDARGAAAFPGLRGGWQKFVGQMVRTGAPHGLTSPIIMDGNRAQYDGFRFVYVLPFSEDTVFIEDTYYSDTPDIDAPALRERIAAYARSRSWTIAEVLDEEQGVLPVVADGEPHALIEGMHGAARIGVAAGLFHPLTGYSLPTAVRVAMMIADLPDMSGEAIAGAVENYARAHWRSGRFYRLLARMLFGAAPPDKRYRVFARFYRLNDRLIERFYAGQSTWKDRLRLLIGRPPVPLIAALACLVGRGRVLADLGAPGRLSHDTTIPAFAGETEGT